MKKWILIYILFFQYFVTYCQSIESGLLPIYSIQTERIKSINEIAEDKSGFLWLATNKGLFTFDGNTLSRFDKLNPSLLKAYYSYVFIDSKDRIWAGTISNGLICIDNNRNIIKEYSHHPNDNSSLADNRIKLIFEDYKKNIWVGTHTSGLNKFDSKTEKFIHYRPSTFFLEKDKRNIDEFISHTRDSKKKYIEWIGTLDGLLKLNVDKNSFELFYCDKNSIANKSDLNGLENQVRSINFSKEGMFLGTWGGGICTLDSISNSWDCYKFQTPSLKSHTKNNVIYAKVNKQKDLILSIYGYGTMKYFPKTKSLIPISKKYLNKYFIDSKNQEWYLFDHKFLYVKTQEGSLFNIVPSSRNITSFYFDKEKNLIYNGVYDKPQIVITDRNTLNSTIIKYKPAHNNGSNWVFNIYKNSHGQLIFHENRDLYTIKDGKLSLFFNFDLLPEGENFSKNSTLSSYVDSDNEIWLGYKESGILRINPKTKTHILYNEKNGLYHSGWISTLFEDNKKRIWYGTEKSLSFFDKKENEFYNIVDSSRSFNYINSITQDLDGFFWVCEGNNILKIKVWNDKSYSIKTISTPENIGYDITINQIDSIGNFWGSSQKGIFYLNTKKETFNFWGKTYGFKDVLDIELLNNDSMLLVTYNGILKGKTSQLFQESLKATLDLTYLKLFNKDYYYKDKPLKDLKELELSYKQNFITIGFSLKHIIEPDDLHFEYKLEGLRNDWIPIGNRNFIELSHLNPGNYKLQIRQTNIGQESIYSKKLKINIQAPFWKTLWFEIILFSLFGTLIYYYINRRKKKMKYEFDKEVAFQKKLANVEMMALKSQMNPHFVFNCLNTIKLFVLENKTEKASRYISDFAKLLRIALNESRLDLTSLDQELESIKLYIELEKMRFEQKFDYVISFPNNLNLNQYKVPPMLLQPFVENAIQHGILPSKNIGKLTVDIKKESGYFTYTILDNGIGRVASQKIKINNQLNPSLGINITNDRLKLIKTIYGMEATINIIDLEQNGIAQGTKVVVKIPIIIESSK